MAFTTTDEGSGLDSNFDTGALVTKGELYAILAQLKETQKPKKVCGGSWEDFVFAVAMLCCVAYMFCFVFAL